MKARRFHLETIALLPTLLFCSVFPTIAPAALICNEIRVPQPSSIRPKGFLPHRGMMLRHGQPRGQLHNNNGMYDGPCAPRQWSRLAERVTDKLSVAVIRHRSPTS